jgi:ABC-type sugar transport system ATPase subunit
MATLGLEARERFGIKTETLTAPIGSLSGGNQQKVAIAAAIIQRPDVLVLEEPTRGVDVGSKREIYELLRRFVDDGSGVLMFCTEDSEVFEAADRVHVVARGTISPPLPVGGFSNVESLAAELVVLEQLDARSRTQPSSHGSAS